MKSAFTAFVASALLAQQTAATGWGDAQSFPNPANQNNNCSASQQSGFSWQGLPTGSFSSFGGFDFSGFSCQNQFAAKGKRWLLPRSSGFQPKCIQGSLPKAGSGGAPTISCGQQQEFSITQMQVSTSYDTPVDFHFAMPDGSTCTHTADCSAAGSIISNDQCGGAKSVTFQMPDHGSDTGCSIGIHSVGFDCQSSTSTPQVSTPSSTSTVVSSTTSSPVTTTTSSVPASNHFIGCGFDGLLLSARQLLLLSQQLKVAHPPSLQPLRMLIPLFQLRLHPRQLPRRHWRPRQSHCLHPASSPRQLLLTSSRRVVTWQTVTSCPVTQTLTTKNQTLTTVHTTLSTTIVTSTTTFCPKCGEAPPTGPPTSVPASSTPAPSTSAPCGFVLLQHL